MEKMKVYPLTIDYNNSLNALIAAAAGRRSYVGEDITEQNFPVRQGPTKVETALLKFKQPVRTEEVLAEMERSGLRPATLMELMTFAVQHSNGLGFERSTVELGSFWTCPENIMASAALHSPDRRYVVFISRALSGRVVGLHRFQDTWIKGTCFLAGRQQRHLGLGRSLPGPEAGHPLQGEAVQLTCN